MHYWQEIITPAVPEFSPDFIAVSAGQDNHFTDRSGLALLHGGTQMDGGNEAVAGYLAGKVAAVLKGGYSVEEGFPTNLGVIAAMAGLDLSGIREPLAFREQLVRAVDPRAMNRVREMAGSLKGTLAPYWNAFR